MVEQRDRTNDIKEYGEYLKDNYNILTNFMELYKVDDEVDKPNFTDVVSMENYSDYLNYKINVIERNNKVDFGGYRRIILLARENNN